MLLTGQQGLGDFLVSALASHWLEDCANVTPTPEENDQYSANHSLVQYKQQANLLLLMNNYTPLVISWNDTNKLLTLLSQRKLALNLEKYTYCSARDWDGKDYLRIIPRVVLVEDPRLT